MLVVFFVTLFTVLFFFICFVFVSSLLGCVGFEGGWQWLVVVVRGSLPCLFDLGGNSRGTAVFLGVVMGIGC